MSKATILVFLAALMVSVAIGSVVYLKKLGDEQEEIKTANEVRDAMIYKIGLKMVDNPALKENVDKVDLNTLVCVNLLMGTTCSADGKNPNEKYIWEPLIEKFEPRPLPVHRVWSHNKAGN